MNTKFDIGQFVYVDRFGSSLEDLIILPGTIVHIEITKDKEIQYTVKHADKNATTMYIEEQYLYSSKEELIKKYL